MGTDHPITKPIIYFDGVCNLCNASVQFVIKRDKDEQFHFASLQSEYAKKNLPEALTNDAALQSIVLQEGEHLKTKSSAALSISRKLSGGWSLLYAFMIIPKFIRDVVYQWIARNRYRWFGKQDECMIPAPELKARFLD